MRRLLLFIALAALGCSSNAPAIPDAQPWLSDGGVDHCDEINASIGVCRVAGTGEDCSGGPNEDRLLIPLDDGDEVPLIVGPQGASMFVFALQTSEIFPGDPGDPTSEDNPHVDIVVLDGELLVSRRLANVGFVEVPDQEATYSVAGLFLVVDDARGLPGQELLALARVTDRDGAERCGELSFIAGL